MNIKAIITMLLLGSSSVALARPAHVHDEDCGHVQAGDDGSRSDRDSWQDQRWDRDRWDRGPRGPMRIGSGVQLSTDGRAFIPVGLERGRFRAVRLDGVSGRLRVQQVAIEFANGQTQVIRGIDRTVTRWRPLVLDLDGGARRVVRVVVYGQPAYSRYEYDGRYEHAGRYGYDQRGQFAPNRVTFDATLL